MILTQHLFESLDNKLIELLRSLSDEDWNKPTIAPLWTVKDIAAHLLGPRYGYFHAKFTTQISGCGGRGRYRYQNNY
jgi:uncharacterized damage-inducible protein DinB